MTSLNVSAAIEKQTLSVAEEVLFQRMFLEKTLFMPQVKVFNKQGVLLYGTNKADEELKERKKLWKPRGTDYNSGTLWKYSQTVGSAQNGAITHPGAEKETHIYADI